MTPQAKNSVKLYAGGNPATIEKLLRMQKPSVVNELKEHFNCPSNGELAERLSLLPTNYEIK